ncbi:MAG: RES family NAD+ phosphorylase [Microbacteriaceae bacterium]
MFDVSSGPYWRDAPASFYRYTPRDPTFDPAAPWLGNGRFDMDAVKTLYVAYSAKGAVAEYFRRHPELLGLASEMIMPLWEIRVESESDALDVRHATGQATVGIPLNRLISSETDEVERYAECRELARLTWHSDLVGIAYPSAAATWTDAWNLVLFGESDVRWKARTISTVSPPTVDPGDIRTLS